METQNKTTEQKPMEVKDFNGEKINIKLFKQSLIDFPCHYRAYIDDYGTPFLVGCVSRESKCGCEIVGNGTLQFPMMIKFCKKHKSVK